MSAYVCLSLVYFFLPPVTPHTIEPSTTFPSASSICVVIALSFQTCFHGLGWTLSFLISFPLFSKFYSQYHPPQSLHLMPLLEVGSSLWAHHSFASNNSPCRFLNLLLCASIFFFKTLTAFRTSSIVKFFGSWNCLIVRFGLFIRFCCNIKALSGSTPEG